MSSCDGAELHRRVATERWCVTRADLRQLRAVLEDELRQGNLTPTTQDVFDAADMRYGPQVYTVTLQLIKPRTKAAGSMSWALMLHPEGIKCDVYVTHAWQEGIFEFLDKVLTSWPFSAKNAAWCCMLALPQNLDISRLIQDPKESPFAVALRVSSYVMVVPNSKASVYSRLWCAYEAYVAYQSDKIIITASPPMTRDILSGVITLMLFAGAGCLVGYLLFVCLGANQIEALLLVYKAATLFAFSFAVGTFFTTPFWWRLCNLGGIFCIALPIFIGHVFQYKVLKMAARIISHGYGEGAVEGSVDVESFRILTYISVFIFWLVSEKDRIQSAAADQEAIHLTKHYTGSVRHAFCTLDEDRRRILADIGDKMPRVDETIAVLIAAGIQTPSLREAADRKVDITGAARSRVAPIFFLVLLQLIGEWYEFTSDGLSAEAMFHVLCLLTFLLGYATLPLDGRVFAQAVTEKAFCVCIILWTPLIMLGHRWQWLNPSIVTSALILVAALLIIARVHRIARVPYCGPCLARFLFARTFQRCLRPDIPVQKACPFWRNSGSCLSPVMAEGPPAAERPSVANGSPPAAERPFVASGPIASTLGHFQV